MEKEITLEMRRQAFHIAAGMTAAFAISYGILGWKELGLILIAGAMISFASRKAKIPVVSWFLENFERKNAAFPGKGAIFMMLSATIVAAFFDRNTAAAAIAILAAGDSVSHIAGRILGKTRHPFNRNKQVEGTIIGFIAASAAALIFVPLNYAIPASAVAMAVEGIELKLGKTLVDDNLTIPLVAALVIYGIQLW